MASIKRTLNNKQKPDLHVNAKDSLLVKPEVKTEQPENVKQEVKDCLICLQNCEDCLDIHCTETPCNRLSINDYVCKVANIELDTKAEYSKVICKQCFEIIHVLELAEAEYLRLKNEFEIILRKNPLFDTEQSHISVSIDIKNEQDEDYCAENNDLHSIDSEDEPLLKIRKPNSKKKTKTKKGKKKTKKQGDANGKLRCKECNLHVRSQEMGIVHLLVEHQLELDETNYEEYLISTDEIRKDEPTYDSDSTWREPTEEENHFTTRPTRTHSLSKKKGRYPCKSCKAVFTSEIRLENHTSKRHGPDGPPYVCEICGAKYKHKKSCEIHVKIHKGIGDWKCEECDRLFPSKGALDRHNFIHTGTHNYQCDQCGKSFIHLSSFKMHKLAHSGLKAHSCHVCGLALMTKSHLKRHIRVHTGEKRYECNVCEKKFSERYNLLAHMKSHEPGAPRPPRQDKPRLPPFRCHVCEMRFDRKYMLDRHLENAHQRIVEKGPPKPRNTMTKLLKAQAAAVKARHDQDSHVQPEPQERAPPVDKSAPQSENKEKKPFVMFATVTPGGQVKSEKDKRTDETASSRPETQSAPFDGSRVPNAWNGSTYIAEYPLRMPDFSQ